MSPIKPYGAIIFNAEEIRAALAKSGMSTAAGSGGLATLHLYKLSPYGIAYLIALLSLS